MRTRLVLAAGLVAAGLTSLPGIASAAPAPAVLQARTTAEVPLPAAGGTLQPVETVTVGKGPWTVTSDVTAVNFGAGDFVRCQLRANSTLIDGGSTVFLAGRVGGVTEAGTFVATGTTTVGVYCEHDNSSSTTIYIDPGATVTAVHGGPIRGPGAPRAASPTVVESRTTSSTPLTSTGYTTVVSVVLPTTGTWAITTTAAAVNFGAFDYAACYLGSGSGAALSNAFSEAGVEGTDAAVSGLEMESTATVTGAGVQVDLDCASSFTNGIYIDAGATMTATEASPSAVTHTDIAQKALPNAGGTAKVVSTTKMAAGAWRVRSNVIIGDRFPNNAYGSGHDFLRCTLAANGSAIDGGATVLITSDSNIQQVVNAGSFTSSTAWTLTLACSHDANYTGAGHWTIVDGATQAINRGPIN